MPGYQATFRRGAGFGWLSDLLTAADQTGALSRLLAWSSFAAAGDRLNSSFLDSWLRIQHRFDSLNPLFIGDEPLSYFILPD
jgi:hypothetical protein